MTVEQDGSSFDEFLERYHDAANQFVGGDHTALERLYSQADDVSLGNPFGPFVRGFQAVADRMRHAALNYRDGKATGFELVACTVTPDLAYTVEVEQFRAKMGGQDSSASVTLRCTSVFRPEAGEWKVVHRHADPITSTRSADSVIER